MVTSEVTWGARNDLEKGKERLFVFLYDICIWMRADIITSGSCCIVYTAPCSHVWTS